MVSIKLNHLNFSQKELAELLNSSKDGNTKSFEKLSSLIKDISYSYFISKHHSGRISKKEDAEDLTNNVYLAFAEQYQNIVNLEYWLRRVLFLSYINWYKKDKVQKTYEFKENLYEEEHSFSSETNLDSERIMNFLSLLPEEKQEVVRMRFWRDLKFSDIAIELNKSEQAVKKIFYRTIEELKNMIGNSEKNY